MSKHGIVGATSRFATPWNTRAQRSCFSFICGLAGTASANDEVAVSGYWSKRGNGTTTGVIEADSIPTLAVNAGAGGAVAGVKGGLVCGHEQLQRVESSDAAQREIEGSVRLVDWRVLSSHRWVRQRERLTTVKTTPQKTRFRDVKYARIWDTD